MSSASLAADLGATVESALESEAGVSTSAEHLLPERLTDVAPLVTATPAPPEAAPSPALSKQTTSSATMQSADSSGSEMLIPAVPAQVPIPAPAVEEVQPAPAPATPEVVSPEVARPDIVPVAPAPLVVPSQVAADDSVPAGYNSVFIDPTDYSVGATQNPDSPSIVFSERSTGCEITVGAGSTTPSQGCVAAASAQASAAEGGSTGGGGLRVGPVSLDQRGLSLGNTTVISREYFNEKLRPLNVLRRGNEEFVFPLSVPAPITSLFGWRMHPIFGEWRFHSGTDLGAPMGTPVLATQAGRVTVADYLGGYGLTVILQHGNGERESRYGHLSKIAVSAGEWIEQGEVIGLVGSTGNSTGPHLHFEVRQMTDQGWMAMDPQEVLEYGLANLVGILDHPLQALNLSPDKGDGEKEDKPMGDYPYRPAQPNAS